MSANSALDRLQNWYLAHCDGEWEHGYGVKIDTIDNPGWALEINLRETELENRLFSDLKVHIDHETKWMTFMKRDGAFEAYGGPLMLSQMIEHFLVWADVNPQSHD